MKSIRHFGGRRNYQQIQKKSGTDSALLFLLTKPSKLSNDELCGRGILGPSWGSLLKAFVQKDADKPPTSSFLDRRADPESQKKLTMN